MPKKKKAISLRLDPDILDGFKQEEEQYQTKIYMIFRAFMEAHRHR